MRSIADQVNADQERIAAQEARLDAEMERLRVERARLADMRAEALRSRTSAASEAAVRLDALVEQRRNDRAALADRLNKLRSAQAEARRGDIDTEKSIWEMERESRIEQLARARLKVDALREQRRLTERLLDQQARQLVAIDAERKERGVTATQRLEAALQRVELLDEEMKSGGFSAKEKERLALLAEAKALADGSVDESTAQFSLKAELEQIRRRRRDMAVRENQERTRRLNEERVALQEREAELARKRATLEALREKGTEFLVEIELGNAPPMHLITRNLDTADEEGRHRARYEAEDDELDLEEFVDGVTTGIDGHERQIEALRKRREDEFKAQKELAKPPWPDTPYDGYLGIESYRMGQEDAYRVASAIVADLVDDFVAHHVKDVDQERNAIAEQFAMFRVTDERVQFRLAERSVLSSMREFANDVIEELIIDVAGEAIADAKHFESVAEARVKELLLGAVTPVDASEDKKAQLRFALTDARAARLARDAARRSMGAPLHVHSLHLTFVTDTGQPKEKRKILGADGDEEDQEATPLYISDCEVVDTRPDVDPEDYAMEGERIYWNMIDFQPVFIELNTRRGGLKKISSLQGSPDARFLAAGTAKGAVGVYDLRPIAAAPLEGELPQPPLIFTYEPGSRPPVASIAWSLDSSSSLITCDLGNMVSVYLLKPETAANAKGAANTPGTKLTMLKQFGARFPHSKNRNKQAPERLWRRTTFNADQLRRITGGKSRSRDDDTKRELPIRVALHPATTMMGFQPGILVGCENGLVVKLNMNHFDVRADNMLHRRYPMFDRDTYDKYLVALLAARRRRRKEAARAARKAGKKGAEAKEAADAVVKGRRTSNVGLAAAAVPLLQIGDSQKFGSGLTGSPRLDTGRSEVEGVTSPMSGGALGIAALDPKLRLPDDVKTAWPPVLVGAPPCVPFSEPRDPTDSKVGRDPGDTGGSGAGAGARSGRRGSDSSSSDEGDRVAPYMMRADVPVVKREFFQGHNAPIVLVAHVSLPPDEPIPTPLGEPSSMNESHPPVTLVTVDRAGHVFLWPYRTDELGGFGWFTPAVKLRVDMRLPTFTVKPGAQTTRVFPKKGAPMPVNPGGDPQFIRASRKAEARLHPLTWSTSRMENGTTIVVRHPPPRTVPEEGAPFDVATFSGSGMLIKVERQVYIPAARTGRLIDVCVAAGGRELVFLILMPPSPPRVASLRLAVLNLVTQKLRPVVLAIPAVGTGTPFMRVTPVLDTPSSDYVYLLMDNLVRVISLSTGKPVVGNLMPLRADQRNKELTAMDVVGEHKFLALAGPNLNVLYIYRIKDRSSRDVQAHCALYCRSERRFAVPAEQKLRRIKWDISEGHALRAIEDIVDDIVEFTFFRVDRKARKAERRKSRAGVGIPGVTGGADGGGGAGAAAAAGGSSRSLRSAARRSPRDAGASRRSMGSSASPRASPRASSRDVAGSRRSLGSRRGAGSRRSVGSSRA